MSGGPAVAAHLPAAEAAVLLRELLDGAREARVAPGSRSLISVAVGEWTAHAGDAELVFFIDSASLDHLVRMRSGDGRQAGFADWLARDGCNPLDLLDDDERLALEMRLRETN